MNRKYILGLLGIMMLSGTNLEAQQKQIRGRIVDRETGEALPGATIRSSKGLRLLSDLEGRYSLPLLPSDTIHISYVGFIPQSVPASRLVDNGQIFLSAGKELQDLVVTASIASARNTKALGAKVDKINIERLLAQGSATSLTDALDGRVSGVQMYQSNGKVGMPLRFNMRSGATMSMDRDPIIYVDGVRYNNTHISDINTSQDALSALNDLSMDDIASIDIIKGPAAAASYGAEAANGVIVITTKRKAQTDTGDGKLSLGLKYSEGWSTLARRYDQFVNNAALNDFFVKGHERKVYANLSKAFAGNNQIYFSASHNSTSGIVPGNSDKRTSLRAAYDLRHQRASLSLSASYTNGSISLPQTAQGRYDAIWNLMINQKPWPYISPESWAAQRRTYDNDRLVTSVRLGYLLPWGVKLESMLGLDLNAVRGTYLLPYGFLVGKHDEGAKDVSNRRNTNTNWDTKLSKQFVLSSDWRMTTTLLSQLSRRYEQVNKITASRFGGDVENIGATQEHQISETDFEQRTWGLYGEAFFNYRNALFINAGLRRDASNLIGSNVASILYPSLSIAYNIGSLKLRTAYGESGRLPYPTDARTSYVLSGSSAYGATVRPQHLGNPDIRPERMRELELGLDWQLGRHQLSLTGYGQYTTDAIIYDQLLSSDDWVGTRPRNIGRVKGWGVELSYNARLWESVDKAHSLDVFATANYQGNEVVDTAGEDITNYPNVIRKGLPVYAFYYSKVTGPAYTKSGAYDAKVGALESKDYHYLGKPFADLNGGFGMEFRLMKLISLAAKFNYALGASVYNQSFYNVSGLGDNLKVRQEQLSRLASAQVGSAEYKAIAEELARTARKRANFIEPADFLRLSSLSLSVDATKPFAGLSKGYIRSAKLSLSAQNLWLWTNYSGAEPQIEANGGSRQQRGIGSLSRDITNAPTPRSFVGTLSIDF